MSRKYWLGLSMIKGLGPIKLNKLLSYFNNARNIWSANKNELNNVGGIGKLAERIVEQRKKIDINNLEKKLKQKNIKYIILSDVNYPDSLKNIYDPPPVIYFRGQNIFDFPAVAIVGSRRSTAYGRKTAQKFGYELAERGITVVSGMARGIDTYSHKGALKSSGRTIAVLGSGVDYIYPPENRKLYNRIQENGLVISEFPPGTKPLSGNFPRRNRVISGLCRGVIVVEAARKSGSLITANLALEQGREVFAIPGNIDRNQSLGTNNLLKKGAKLVTNVNDVLEEIYLYQKENYQQNVNGEDNRKNVGYPQLTASEEKIINIMQAGEKLQINTIIEKSGLKASVVNTSLLKLELKGLISRESGKKYLFKGLQNLLKPL